MKQFDNVAKFANNSETSKDLIVMTEEYASAYIAKMQAKESVADLADKAKAINNAFCAELTRRSKHSASDFDSVEDFASFSSVAEMGALIQKAMLDAVTPIFINATNLNTLAEFHYGGYGDVFEFELKDNSVYTVSKMGRRQKHTKTQESKKQNITIGTDFYGLSVYSTLPQVILGEDMVIEDIMKMALAMNKKIYSLVVKAFVNGAETISDTNLILSNYNEKQFLKKLRYGSAKNGAKMVIVGDDVALKDIIPSSDRTRIMLNDSYNTTVGHMTSWNGYDVLGFDVVADDAETDGVLGLPTNRVYGFPTNGSKLIHIAIGTTMTNADDHMDANDLTAVTTFRKELGVQLATNLKVVKVTLA